MSYILRDSHRDKEADKARMSFNHGRPVLMTDDETLSLARQFLTHPLSNSTDARLVVSCELLAMRGECLVIYYPRWLPEANCLSVSLHQPVSFRPSVFIPDLESKLQEQDKLVQEWFTYWDGFYGQLSMNGQFADLRG